MNRNPASSPTLPFTLCGRFCHVVEDPADPVGPVGCRNDGCDRQGRRASGPAAGRARAAGSGEAGVRGGLRPHLDGAPGRPVRALSPTAEHRSGSPPRLVDAWALTRYRDVEAVLRGIGGGARVVRGAGRSAAVGASFRAARRVRQSAALGVDRGRRERDCRGGSLPRRRAVSKPASVGAVLSPGGSARAGPPHPDDPGDDGRAVRLDRGGVRRGAGGGTARAGARFPTIRATPLERTRSGAAAVRTPANGRCGTSGCRRCGRRWRRARCANPVAWWWRCWTPATRTC